MKLRQRHRRWIALVALLGMLFQQIAMAAYVCPAEMGGVAGGTVSDFQAPPCHSPATLDKSRCHQHCHPLVQTSDHESAPTVAAALLPPTTWLRHCVRVAGRLAPSAHAHDARNNGPPLTIQHCTFQI
jgi:hypothetical protein